MANIEDYEDIAGDGIVSKEPIKPEDEFFHSVYIAGQSRTNHINITELAGKFQIRGVEYNITEVNMVITHVKEILAKIVNTARGESTECFSYKNGEPPWFGTSKLPDGNARQCPVNSSERALVEFCNSCRSQIIVGGVYCKPDGSPFLKDKKPIFIFIRAKGIKYSNVSNYLGDMYKKDLSPIFTPVTERTIQFEKANVNNKRFVTKITSGKASSSYGEKDVFVLTPGVQLADQTVMEILKISKKTKEKFIEKFDWSKRTGGVAQNTSPQAEGVLEMEGSDSQASEQSVQDTTPEPQGKPFSFEDIEID